jgi:hypothetical protein
MKKTAVSLPPPINQLGRRYYWRKRAIREFLATVANEPAPVPLADDEFLITVLEVRLMLGSVSDRWINRHLPRQPKPQPAATTPSPASPTAA